MENCFETSAATKFKVHRRIVDRIWSRYNDSVAAGDLRGDVPSRYKGNSDRKCYDRVEFATTIRSVHVEQRTNYPQTANALGLSVGLIFNLMTNKAMVKRTTPIKPILTHGLWATSMMSHCQNQGHAFDPMLHLIHIDEKWFTHDKKTRWYIMLPGEEPPQRHHQSARHVGKTMFMAAVAQDYAAQRSSKNRSAGTDLMQNIKVVDTNVYKHFLIDYVFPAIKAKWPRRQRRMKIYVQLDNASPHISRGDKDVLYRALQYRTYVRTTLVLKEVVQASFKDLDIDTLDNIFITL
ncbi:LOW QUALITY PROTEIN: Mar9 Transposase, partial [Phytophthora megakarya]